MKQSPEYFILLTVKLIVTINQPLEDNQHPLNLEVHVIALTCTATSHMRFSMLLIKIIGCKVPGETRRKTKAKKILPWPPRVRKGIRLMAMGTVPCLLWKWWTWWVVLREEETRAATAGHGNTSSARESTSLNRKAGLAHTTGDAVTGLDIKSNPPSTSTSTSCSMGAGPESNERPLPLIRHKQEVNISNESRAHDPQPSSPGRKNEKKRRYGHEKILAKREKKQILVRKSPKRLQIKMEKFLKKKKSFLK